VKDSTTESGIVKVRHRLIWEYINVWDPAAYTFAKSTSTR